MSLFYNENFGLYRIFPRIHWGNFIIVWFVRNNIITLKHYEVTMSSILKGINVLFIAGFGPVTTNTEESASLYKDILQLPLETIDGYDGYLHSQNIPGAKYFAVWPLDKVALSCFGTSEWPASLPVPQAWLEFEVDDMQSASEILKESGCKLLTCMQEEPWEQTVTRFLSPEGIIMAISYTPFLRQASERE